MQPRPVLLSSCLLLLCLMALVACGQGAVADVSDERLSDRVSGAAIVSLSRLGSRSAAFRSARAETRAEKMDVHYILDGEEAAPSDWPFAVSLLFEEDDKFYHYCGGSLIRDRWVLTAAHCGPLKGDLVVLGRHDLRSVGGIVLQVEKVVPHSFNKRTGDNDLALIFLSAPGAPGLAKASLASPPAAGQDVTAIGWGAISENGPASAALLQVTVPVWEHSDCVANYATIPRAVTPNMVCAGEEGRDACEGDSGGPLLAGASGSSQVGIVSFGEGCGRKSFPGVYTRVDQYLQWIQDNAV